MSAIISPEQRARMDKREANYAAGIFWMLAVDDAGSPTVRHYTEEDAVIEAERLARHTKRKVFMLRSMGIFEVAPTPVTRKDLP
jgi:hypothetical protein